MAAAEKATTDIARIRLMKSHFKSLCLDWRYIAMSPIDPVVGDERDRVVAQEDRQNSERYLALLWCRATPAHQRQHIRENHQADFARSNLVPNHLMCRRTDPWPSNLR